MTEWDYNKDTDNLMKLVNEHHKEFLKKEKERFAIYDAKKQKFIDNLSINPSSKKSIKKNILSLDFSNPEKCIIKNVRGELVGVISFSVHVKSAVMLSGTKPVFVIFRDNEIYFEKDVITGEVTIKSERDDDYQKVVKQVNNENPMIEYTKYIYKLIENKKYDQVGLYINNCMEKLISSNFTDAKEKKLRDIYVQAQVRMRNIYKIQSKINECINNGTDYKNLDLDLDILYRQICEMFLNLGFYEIPEIESTIITKR